ncbi:RpiR family transcriptional regulator [Acrocarpospora pleiomorpha]|uniref:RpiR family transcriptional regulator n=1 Tax=Acrocarpospora pleiomorpha TaxID=90975 RepID=A0A5M3XTE7_9ACTN|nr:MurR/RpiR family transcriptional regulator [Acrocarpospora pleiomorpha]GES22781.1 RpiR family transcriptional regulator [Acrocarpospora pleiomorpha]
MSSDTSQELTSIVEAPRGVFARIRAGYPSLPPGERKVADLLLNNSQLALSIPINELAERIGVSDATIVRCSQSLGFEGFRGLKLALAAESSPSNWLVKEAVDADDGAMAIAKKVFSSGMQAISDTLGVLEEATLERAIDAIRAARRIEFYGVGSSVPIALDAYYRLLRLGLPATIATDPHMQAISAANLPPGAVAFAVSHSGRSFETHAALRRAKEAGATTVLLTSYRNTPLSDFADIELVTSTPESTLRPDAVSCRLAHLAVVDALSVAVAVRTSDTSTAALLKDDEIIAEREVAN